LTEGGGAVETVKVSISLPDDLWCQIKEIGDNVSGLIAQAMRDYVARVRLDRALEETAGAWTD
jgi:post-segregation antitoxin (ccd killing protein)